MPPLFADLDYFTFPTINVTNYELFDDISIDFEFDSFKIVEAGFDTSPSCVKIKDPGQGVTIGFENLYFSLIGDYSFITDPPIAADIGQASI